jgi:hypothetical protein
VEPIRSPVTVSLQELSLAEWPELIKKVTALGSVAPFEVSYSVLCIKATCIDIF